MRFQPRQGRLLAAAVENVVSILDVETQACRHSLQVGCYLYRLIIVTFAMLTHIGDEWSFDVHFSVIAAFIIKMKLHINGPCRVSIVEYVNFITFTGVEFRS